MKDAFRFAELQENATVGLGYKLTIQRKSDGHLLSHRERTGTENLALARGFTMEVFSWFGPLYTPENNNKN